MSAVSAYKIHGVVLPCKQDCEMHARDKFERSCTDNILLLKRFSGGKEGMVKARGEEISANILAK